MSRREKTELSTQIVDKKQFLYLHKILTTRTHWTHRILNHIRTHNSGWAKHIADKLTEYGLETDWDLIKRMTPNEWKEKARVAFKNKREKND